MEMFVLPDAVPPLSLQSEAGGWTVWDARKVPVLRTMTGSHVSPNKSAVSALIPQPPDAENIVDV